MKVTNNIILAELLKVLEDMDYFRIYPSRQKLKVYLGQASSDGDKIRTILRDEYVQRELFPDWEIVTDPMQRYLQVRGSL